MSRARTLAPHLLPTLVVAGAYIAASEAAHHWLRASGNAPIVWVAPAVGLAALLLRGPAILPAVALGAFVCALLEGDGPLFGVVSAAVIAGQIALSGWLLVRVFAFDSALERVRDVLALILIGATVSPLCNAVWSLAVDEWRGTMPMPERLLRVQVTSLGEAVGILLLVPVVLTVTAVPISLAGWGVREGAAIFLFGLVGMEEHDALAISLCYGLLAAVTSLPGGIVWLVTRERDRAAARAA
jgi:integral membrane sensor domain MASE1